MFQWILYTSLVILGISLVLFFIRIMKGPSVNDRILGLDALGISLVGFIGVVMILQKTLIYADIILVLSILSFIGTVAMSKFVEGGSVFDRD